MIVENITLTEYFNTNGEQKELYDFLFEFDSEFNKSVNFFDIKELNQFTFKQIKDFQEAYSKPMSWQTILEFMSIFTDKKIKDLCSTRILYISQFKNYLIEQIELINLVEQKELGYEATEKEIAAGIDSFNIFGAYSQYRELTFGDVTKNEQIGGVKYTDCFIELSYRKRLSVYEKRLTELNKPRV